MLKGKDWIFPLKTKIKKNLFSFTISIKHITQSGSHSSKARKGNKRSTDWKERIKTVLTGTLENSQNLFKNKTILHGLRI
jgi:hypothetical protein